MVSERPGDSMAKYFCIALAICAMIGLASSQACSSTVLSNLKARMLECGAYSVPATENSDPAKDCTESIVNSVAALSACSYWNSGNVLFDCLLGKKINASAAVGAANCIGNWIAYGGCCS